jgi:primosomal protein N' (replication factor Y)
VLHSGLAESERLAAWTAAKEGEARVVIGTRSAVFVPLPDLGVVIVDEEHDVSYKQQDGFRYSGRDLAVVRARQAGVPVVLGSATPSLESLHNVATARYTRLELCRRPTAGGVPALALVDLRRRRLRHGLSEPLLAALSDRLGRGEQVLLFLNRRGYAPALLCHACGWAAACERCDAHLTVHHRPSGLRCHHCGAARAVPAACPRCGAGDLLAVGSGTERLEAALHDAFPQARVARVDRDSVRRRGALEAVLARARAGEVQVLIGTQMLAKGHDFPRVTLVGIVDADGGLFSADFRAEEHLAQRILQVAGRAGRGERPGEVLIQTHFPEHPLLQALLVDGYPGFAARALEQRRQAGLPPCSSAALLRAESPGREASEGFLVRARDCLAAMAPATVQVLGPAPALLERRAGRYRMQLLVLAQGRARMREVLERWIRELERLESARLVRWSLDVDPIEAL